MNANLCSRFDLEKKSVKALNDKTCDSLCKPDNTCAKCDTEVKALTKLHKWTIWTSKQKFFYDKKRHQEEWCKVWTDIITCTYKSCQIMHDNWCRYSYLEKRAWEALNDITCDTKCESPQMKSPTNTLSPELKSSATYSVMKPSALLTVFIGWLCGRSLYFGRIAHSHVIRPWKRPFSRQNAVSVLFTETCILDSTSSCVT